MQFCTNHFSVFLHHPFWLYEIRLNIIFKVDEVQICVYHKRCFLLYLSTPITFTTYPHKMHLNFVLKLENFQVFYRR